MTSSRPRCIEEYLRTKFRFTDKEDRVGVGVYDVILKYDPGRYMLTMGRKQEPLCKKYRGVTDQISYTTIDRQSGTTRKKS